MFIFVCKQNLGFPSVVFGVGGVASSFDGLIVTSRVGVFGIPTGHSMLLLCDGISCLI